MAVDFDAYQKWLGISSSQRPLHFYNLLGVDLFESDANVIRAAANRQIARIHKQADDADVEVMNELLTQVRKAGVTLLDPRKRSQYDRRLKAKLGAPATGEQAKTLRTATPLPNEATNDDAGEMSAPVVPSPDSLASPSESAGDLQSSISFSLSSAAREEPVEPSRPGGRRIKIEPRFLVVVALAILLVVGGVVAAIQLPEMLSSEIVAKVDDEKTDTPVNRDPQRDDSAETDSASEHESPKRGTPTDTSPPTSQVDPPDQQGRATTDAATSAKGAGTDGGETLDPLNLDAGKLPKEVFSDETSAEQGGDADAAEAGGDGGADPDDNGEPDEGDTPDAGETDGNDGEPDEPAIVSSGPVPDEEDLETARREVRDEHAEKLQTADAYTNRARLLIEQAIASDEQPARQYALLELARESAVLANNLATAWQAENEFESRFDIDKYGHRAVMLRSFAERLPADHAEADMLKQGLDTLLTESMEDDNFAAAEIAVKTAAALSRKWKAMDLASMAARASRQVKIGLAWSERIENAKQVLKDNPNDPDANMMLGSYHGFVRGDWLRAAPYLTHSKEPTLQAAANMEMTVPPDPAGQVKVGEAWLAAATQLRKQRHAGATAARLRSRKWMLDAWRASEEKAKQDIELKMVSGRDLLVNKLGMKFLLIPPGQFMMGSPVTEKDRENTTYSVARNNLPVEETQHPVQIKKAFYIGMHEVTQAEYQKLMKVNPSAAKGNSALPVEQVSWNDAAEFCRRLSKVDGRRNYRLPTEAEWEYACRAGTPSAFYFGNELTHEQAQFSHADKGPVPVASFPPNAYGLFDMHGNVFEWVADAFQPDYYKQLAAKGRVAVDPYQQGTGNSRRITRGGGYRYSVAYCRSACRRPLKPTTAWPDTGLRLVVAP